MLRAVPFPRKLCSGKCNELILVLYFCLYNSSTITVSDQPAAKEKSSESLPGAIDDNSSEHEEEDGKTFADRQMNKCVEFKIL